MTSLPCSPLIQPGGQPFDAFLSKNVTDRVVRLCNRAVEAMSLDLKDLVVLTEAATGPFAVTPLIAALAGGEVRAVGRSGKWGSASDAFDQVRSLARKAGVEDRISFHEDSADFASAGAHLVTNLGPIRPIGSSLIEQLDSNACIALMWEPWEFRHGEIDLNSLIANEIALIATNEQHSEIQTFKYIGPAIARLLFEIGVEIVNSRLLVIGSDPFGKVTEDFLRGAGALVYSDYTARNLDAVIYVENSDHNFTLGGGDVPSQHQWRRDGAPVIRLCGQMDERAFFEGGVSVFPHGALPSGVMSVTTAFAGPRPVIDLHAGGLRAAADVVRARQSGQSINHAITIATQAGYGLPLN